MINLRSYRQYWTDRIETATHIGEVLEIAIDKDMAKKIQSLPKGVNTLFILPPISSMGGSSADRLRSSDTCILFIMRKYDPMRQTAFQTLEETQPAIEEIAQILTTDFSRSCSTWRLDTEHISIMPETEFFAGFAGWSIEFKVAT